MFELPDFEIIELSTSEFKKFTVHYSQFDDSDFELLHISEKNRHSFGVAKLLCVEIKMLEAATSANANLYMQIF